MKYATNLVQKQKPSVLAAAAVVIAAVLFGIYIIFFSKAAVATANIWVDLNGGTCTRQATVATYNDGSACSSFDAAWDKASPGDVIVVKTGVYPRQVVTGDKISETKIIGEDGTTIKGAIADCRPEFGAASVFCTEADYLTLENVTLDTGTSGNQAASTRIFADVSNVTFRNVNMMGDFPALYIEGSNFKWEGGTSGNPTPGVRTCDSSYGYPIIFAGGSNITIDGIKFNPMALRVGAGPYCGPDNTPHLETTRINGGSDINIKNSTFVDGSDAGSGHIFSSVAVSRLKLINNYFGRVNATYWIQATNSGNSDWSMLYNTFTQGGSLSASGQTWVGNLGYYQGCSGTHIKNMWSGTGSCGTDTFVGSTSLGVGSDGRLATTSPAINAAETDTASDYCTGTLVSSVDFEGTTRPQGTACDAGADEFGAGSTTPSPPPPPPPPTSDTTAPTVSLTAPANGATVSGTVNITANASDNVGVTKVEFYQGSTKLGEDTSSPYSYSWNTTTVANASYSLTAKAFDAAGLSTTSSAVSVTVSNSPPPPTSSVPMAAYAFNEGSGTIAADSSGNNNTLTMPSTAWTTTGKNGNAASFNGSSTSYAQRADSSTLDLGSTGSIEAWFKPNSLNRWHGIIAKGSANENNDHNYAMEVNNANQVMCVIGNGTGSSTLTSTTTLAAGIFYHLACTWDGTSLRLYINGAQNTSAAQTMTPAGNSSSLYVGQYGGNVDQVDGVVDDVRIYNKTLTASEVSSDMNTAVSSGPADTTAPSVPGTPTATVVSSSQINLSWAASTDNVGVSKYNILRKLSSEADTSFVVVGTVNAPTTSFNNTGLLPSTGYTYRIQAVDAANNTSANSGPVSATTQAAPADSTPPTSFTASLVSASTTQINISWTASSDPESGIKGYDVYRDGVKQNTTILSNATTSFGQTGTFTAGQTYTYVVKAINGVDLTRDSNSLAITISSQTGTVRYVSTTGNDANTCTQAAPCRTINRGYQVAVAGDTVELASGTYGSSSVAFRSGMTDAPVTVRPASGSTVNFTDLNVDAGNIIIKGPNFNIRSMDIGNSGGSSTRRFDITLDNLNIDAQDATNVDAMYIGNTQNLVLRNSKVGNTMAGIGSSDTAKSVMTCAGNSTCHNINMTFENNLFYDADTPSGSLAHLECIWAGGVQGFTLRNNTFRDCTYYNVFVTVVLVNNQPQPKDHIFENNLFGQTLNTSGGDANYSIDVHGDVQPNNFEFKYNTFEGPLATANGGGAIQSGGWKIIGNIMAGGVWLAYNQPQGCRSGIVFEYNVMPTACGSNTTVASSADIRSGWVAPKPSYGGADDFHLLSTSPAINKGRPADAGTLDYDGVTRANPPDAGAYEFVSSTPPPPSDTTPPTVSINSPITGCNTATPPVCSGTITATATAYDPPSTTNGTGIAGVQFKLNGTNVGTEDTIAPYTYSVNTLTLSNGSHTISATARDSAGLVTTSTVTINVQNTDTVAPNPPTSLSGTTTQPTSTTPGSVALTWPAATDNGSPASGIKGYYVYRGTTVISPLIAHTTASSYSYTDPNVTAGSYTYTVRSVDNVNLTSTTASPSYTTTLVAPPAPADTTPPTVPANLTATAPTSSQVNLSWTASTDASGIAGYNIYRNGSTTPLNGTPVTTTSYGDTTVQPATTYTYQVEAIDGVGNKSAKSNTATVNVPAPVTVAGDITGPDGTPDGKVDLRDVSYVIRAYETTDPRADLTGETGTPDGKVDLRDVSYVIRNYNP